MCAVYPYYWVGSRYLIELENFKISYYGFFYSLSFILCFVIVHNSREIFRNWEDALEFVTLISLSSIIFGRLGYVTFYPNSVSTALELFQTWKGGISSHGSLCGIFIVTILFSKYRNQCFLHLLDTAIFLSVVAGFFIRIGNFMNSEKVGSCTDSWFGIVFIQNQSLPDYHLPKHPIQLYEALVCLILIFVSLRFQKILKKGRLAYFLLIYLFTFRFLINYFFNENILAIEQWLNISTVCLGLVLYPKVND